MLKTHNFLLSDFTCYCFWSLHKAIQNCNSTVMGIECEWGAELCSASPSPKPAPSEACWVAVTTLGSYRRGWHTTKHPLLPHSFWEQMCSHSAKTQAARSNVCAHAWPMCSAEHDQHLRNPATSTCTSHPCHCDRETENQTTVEMVPSLDSCNATSPMEPQLGPKGETASPALPRAFCCPTAHRSSWMLPATPDSIYIKVQQQLL